MESKGVLTTVWWLLLAQQQDLGDFALGLEQKKLDLKIVLGFGLGIELWVLGDLALEKCVVLELILKLALEML